MNVQGFKRFAMKQYPGRLVDQTRWGTCAVGDYFRSLEYPAHNLGWDAMEFSQEQFTSAFRSQLCGVQTYGQLQNLIVEQKS